MPTGPSMPSLGQAEAGLITPVIKSMVNVLALIGKLEKENAEKLSELMKAIANMNSQLNMVITLQMVTLVLLVVLLGIVIWRLVVS